jgi:hypothetical protein
MLKAYGLKCMSVIAASIILLLAPAQAQQPSPPLGMNLEVVSPNASQIIFVDVLKRSLDWISFNWPNNFAGDTGVPIPPAPNGYPLQLPYSPDPSIPTQAVATPIFQQMQGHYPAGDYTLIFEGSGILGISGANGEQYFFEGGTYTILVDPSQGELWLEILISDPSDHIQNIRLIMPRHETTYATQPFYQPFLDRL